MKSKKQQKLQTTIEIRRQAFIKKLDEYDKLSLEELKDLYNHPDKKVRPGGIYREALIEVVRKKQIAVVTEVIKEGTEEVKQEEQNTETTTQQ